jgi:hypothetical protein
MDGGRDGWRYGWRFALRDGWKDRWRDGLMDEGYSILSFFYFRKKATLSFFR